MVRDTILTWALGVFGTEVIWTDQDKGQPPKPYGTLHWFTNVDVGFAESIQTELSLDVENQNLQLKRLTVQMEAFTNPAPDLATLEAMELLEGALLTLQAEPTLALFRANGVAFQDHETIIRLDEYTGQNWERRALCDVRFIHSEVDEAESAGRIDTAVPIININY